MLLFNHIHHSPHYGYVYVDTPKVACSTIKHALQCAECGEPSLSDNEDGSARQDNMAIRNFCCEYTIEANRRWCVRRTETSSKSS